MTERRSTELFEARFAELARTYTDPATARRIDALAMARTAIAPQRATGRSRTWSGTGLFGRRIAGDRWPVAIVTVVLIGVVGVAVVGRGSDFGVVTQPTPPASTQSPAASVSGPVPEALRHAWERPYAVTPDLDQWATGYLTLSSGLVDFGPAPDAPARSAIKATGVDTLLATATAETTGCTIGDVGPYGWSIEGKGTVLTLTATGADACPAREQALSGSWVRSDLPAPAGLEATLAPGTHLTSSFDPFGDVGSPGRLSYTVPAGWQAPEDASATLGLQHLPGDAQGPPSMIFLFARPGLAAEINDGEPCGAFSDAPGVGHRVADIVAAIMARPGVVSAQPVSVTVGGYQGQMLDLRLAPSWTDGCIAPEGKAIGVPLIHVAGSPVGPSVGLGPDAPVRLILLDLTGGRTLAVAVACIGPSQPDQIAEQFAQAMPIINSFEFHPPGS